MSFNNFLRISIFGSMCVSIFSRLSNEDICYTCDNEVLAFLFILHSVLYFATYLKTPLSKILTFILLVFFVSRLGILQLDLDFFAYPKFFPTVLQMREILLTLFLVSVSLLVGCFFGERIKLKKSQNYSLLWSSSIKDESLYYSYLTVVFIFSSLVLLYLTIIQTYSPTIDHRLYEYSTLIIAKIARFFQFLGLLSIAWLILRKPRGFQRKLTIFAIFLLLTSIILTGSKLSLISAILPFIFVYYASGLYISRRKKRLFMGILVLTILMFPVFTSLRTFWAAILVENQDYINNVLTYHDPSRTVFKGWFINTNIIQSIFGIAGRVGSSFDVLSFVLSSKDLFVPYANLMAEFVNIINGYYPGEIFKVDSPQWAQRLPSLAGHGNYNTLLSIGVGENIGFIPHLIINFGIFWVCFWSFLTMFFYGISYNYFNMFIRITLLFSVFMGITNGSGFVAMVTQIPIFLLYLMILRMTFRIIRPFLQKISTSKTIQYETTS